MAKGGIEEAGGWPDGMTDSEAVQALQDILITACEGNQDLSLGRSYRQLRRAFLSRRDLADVLPAFVRSHRDLNSFWAYIKGVGRTWASRREQVWEAFRPLFDRAEGLTKPPTQSGAWTGRRRSPAQQAKVVLALGYDAMLGVEALLENFERAHHNGGPIEPAEEKAIEALKALHSELGELIDLAQRGEPLEAALGDLKAASKSAFKWMKEPIGLGLAGLPLTGTATALGVGVMYLVNALLPGVTGAAPAIGAAAAGAHVASAHVRKDAPSTRKK